APHIKLLKRFVADWYYTRHPEPEYGPAEKKLDKKVAVVGSGPAGLSAAYFLAKKGYPVTVYEAGPEPGGMLRSTLPIYRLPKDVVDRDIRNVTALGVEIRANERIQSLRNLRQQGYDAIFVSVGAPSPRKLGIENEDHPDVTSGIDLLAMVNRKMKVDLAGKDVLVIGGGNVAIDVERTARRLGAARVRMMCLEKRDEMPAAPEEIHDALSEGVVIQNALGPKRFVVEAGRLAGVETIQCTSVFNAEGKFAPQFKARSEKVLAADKVFVAIGQESLTAHLAEEGIELNRNKTIRVNPTTLETSVEGIFAGGESVLGPAIIVEAVGQGKRAAFHIDRWLRSEPLEGAEFAPLLPVVSKEDVLARQSEFPARPVEKREVCVDDRVRGFCEVEMQLSEDEALASAANCLNCGICSECQECKNICPADAIDFDQRPVEDEYAVGAVVVATGFRLCPAEIMANFGFGRFANVISAMQMDRLVAPTRPYNYVLRPGDGKTPANIAYVLCTGSRDRTVDNPICSRVCCMYSLKQAQLLLGALPIADVTIYNIDIRAFGKGYDEFFEQTRAMGVRFVKGKIARISEKENGNLLVRYEDIDDNGTVRETEHDLVVLSTGIVAHDECRRLFSGSELAVDENLFVAQHGKQVDPARTSIPGVFSAGTATGPLDIPDSILHAGAAAAQTAAYIEKMKRKS
ncbi:MAG: FAD-dependent oxidoreductase, partial [Hyphomicrobiales bacterium]